MVTVFHQDFLINMHGEVQMSALKNEMSCSESLAIESAVITAESIVVQIGAVFTPLWMYLSVCYIHYSSV